MNCPNCNNMVSEEYTFCDKCGTNLKIKHNFSNLLYIIILVILTLQILISFIFILLNTGILTIQNTNLNVFLFTFGSIIDFIMYTLLLIVLLNKFIKITIKT